MTDVETAPKYTCPNGILARRSSLGPPPSGIGPSDDDDDGEVDDDDGKAALPLRSH